MGTTRGIRVRWKSGHVDIFAASQKSLDTVENYIRSNDSNKMSSSFNFVITDNAGNHTYLFARDIVLIQICNISMRIKHTNPLDDDYDNPLR